MSLKKEKYFDKVASESAVTCTWYRLLDTESLFAKYVWMQLPLFDLYQLGIGLEFSMLPYEFQPFAVDFNYYPASMDELMQGIWANFDKVVYEVEFPWSFDWDKMNEFIFDVKLFKIPLIKAKYGEAKFYGYLYDPALSREYIAEAFSRLRLIRKPDLSWQTALKTVSEVINISPIAVYEIVSRFFLLSSAQDNSFCLGLSLLGTGKLNGTHDGGAVIPYVTPEGELIEVKYWTLENLMFGFILGVTPLGYGVLTPKTPMFKMEEGKKNPEIIDLIINKARKSIHGVTLTTWAYCYDEKTEVLTENGFKRFAELTGNEKIATLNPETDEIEYQYPIAIHVFRHKGKMIHIKGRSIDLLVTPEHKLYVKNHYRERKGKNPPYQFIEAIELLNTCKHQKYRFKRTAKWNCTNIECFRLPEYQNNWVSHGAHRFFKQDEKHIPTDIWLQFFAWYLSEGDTEKRGAIRIANTNEHNLSEIADLVRKMGFAPSIYGNSTKGYNKAGIKLNSVQLANYLRQFGTAQEKFIPKWVKQLPSDKLKIFLETLTRGDGHKDARNWKYYTSSKKLADDIQEIALKAGFTASITEVEDNRYAKNYRMYVVHLDRNRKDTTICKKPEIIDYEGYVYDVTVPKHHIILVRRNGKICWSSNSNYNKPDEMLNYHKSEKVAMHDLIQTQRRMVENIVYESVAKTVQNPVLIRQYQNAVLQAIAWKSKRHHWGYVPFRDTPEEQFKEWWVLHWKEMGLDETILRQLYSNITPWLERLREVKQNIGASVRFKRRMMAFSPYL